jgi:hypothetical protein
MNEVPKRNYAIFFEGECTRLTVPMICLDDIKSASIILKRLSEELDEIAKSEQRMTAKILEARMHCTWASTDLKGGTKYKGRTT